MARLPDPRQQRKPTSANDAASSAGASGQPAQVPTSNPGSNTAVSSSTDARNTSQAPAQAAQQQEEKAKARVVSPELRDLLSRKVREMDGKEIKDHGGGIN